MSTSVVVQSRRLVSNGGTGLRIIVALTCLAMAVFGILAAPPVRADSLPTTPGTPATVTGDPLPTVQINGVAWSQVVLGNTVYVAGSFTNARPAGAAPGVNTTPRSNLLAYDITTGNLIVVGADGECAGTGHQGVT